MKSLLIWPEGMRRNGWAVFPLALGYLQNSLASDLLDCAIDSISNDELRRIIAGYGLIGVSVWGFNLENAKRTLRFISENSDAITVAGGPSAHLAQADYVVTGEGERSLRMIADWIAGKEAELPYQVGPLGQKIVNSEYENNLDIFGKVDYRKLQLDKYIALGFKDWMYTLKDKFRAAPLMSTRGCPYNCSYCQGPVIMGHRVRKHSVEYIVGMIEELYQKHGIRQMSFLDDNLTFDREWFKTLCEEILLMKEKKGYSFIITTLNGVRVNRLDDQLLGLMKKAGWAEIVIAPESGSPASLKRMKKTIDLDDVKSKIDLIHKNRMNVAGYFLVGYPGDTVEDLQLTKKYILESQFDRCIVNFFNPTPGTPIFEELVGQGAIGMGEFENIDYKSIGFVTKELQKDNLIDFQKAVEEKTKFKEMWIKDL